jgi:hypothetical protein
MTLLEIKNQMAHSCNISVVKQSTGEECVISHFTDDDAIMRDDEVISLDGQTGWNLILPDPVESGST